MTASVKIAVACCLTLACAPARALAQTPPPPTAPPTTAPADPQAAPPERADPDGRVDPLQPDFNLAALPTTLRMPQGKWAFRVTHRFTRSLGRGDFGDLLEDFFGFDGGAQIGLEVRYGLLPGTQIGIHRTSDRTIQIFGQQNLLNERGGRPLGLDVLVTLEGDDNLREHHQSAIGVVLSRSVARRATVYAEPIVVVNSNPFDVAGTDGSTMLLGFGTRIRVRPSMYLVGEISPRIGGYDPLVNQISFGLEGRAGGHMFQVNVSNGLGTTLGQLARGGFTDDDWYIGFNIMRKFF
jgi:hypothetical protein